MKIGLILPLVIALYFAAGVLLGVRLSRIAHGRPMSKWGPIALGLLAVVLHASLLYHRIITPIGLNLGFFNALSLVGLLVALLVLLLSFIRPLENLGIVLLPLAALTSGLEIAFPIPDIVARGSWPMEAHIVISILAYSLLSIAALQAIVLAVQDRQLRNKHPGGFIRALPPLQTMESLLFQMIAIGFVLLSLALLSGIIFIHNIFEQHLVHKTVLSIVAWIVFAVLLWGRWRFGWRGRTAIGWTLGGFFALMLAYFGTKLVLELVLHR